MYKQLQTRGALPQHRSDASTAFTPQPFGTTSDGEPVDVPQSALDKQLRVRAVPSVRRATAVLRHLSRHAEGQTVSRIARELDIIPSTCLHILRELIAAGMVSFEPNGKTYRLGLGLLHLANELVAHDRFIQAARQRLQRFAHEHGVSASAQQRDGDDVVIVAAVTASEGLEAPLGGRYPLLCAAGGRLFASSTGWPIGQLRRQFERVRLQKPLDFDTWVQEVAQAKSRGYAIDNGSFRVGVTSIAASVPGRDGSVWRAISINVVSAQLDASRIDAHVDALCTVGADIAEAMR
jgi:DNA-binding IclR family transcriptional regulator